MPRNAHLFISLAAFALGACTRSKAPEPAPPPPPPSPGPVDSPTPEPAVPKPVEVRPPAPPPGPDTPIAIGGRPHYIIEDTLSPTKHLAAAWSLATDAPIADKTGAVEDRMLEAIDEHGVDNHLIDLRSRTIIGTLGSEHWRYNGMVLNWSSMSLTWAADESAFAHEHDGKWASQRCDFYRIANGRLSAPVDLMAPAKRLVLAGLAKKRHPGVRKFKNDFALTYAVVALELGTPVRFRIRITGQVPKSEEKHSYFRADLVMSMSEGADGTPSFTAVSVVPQPE